MKEQPFIIGKGINYAGTLRKNRKANDPMRPIYEAFTNSFDALNSLKEKKDNGKITFKIKVRSKIFSEEIKDFDFDEFVLEDTGIGFNDKEFVRMSNLNDDSKSPFHKGSGRLQFLHFFNETKYVSKYTDKASKTGFFERAFTLSKAEDFLKQNAIVKKISYKEVSATKPLTILTFKEPLFEKDRNFYSNLNIEKIKEKLISHYLLFFCENRDKLPEIKIQYYENDELKAEESIGKTNIPQIDKNKNIELNYYKITLENQQIEKTNKKEILNLKSFKIKKDRLQKNGLYLSSKGEFVQDLKLETLLPEDCIEDNRYLFIISGDYINNREADTRGNINIPTLEEFKKSLDDSSTMFTNEEILMDDIQDSANRLILQMYNEIKKTAEQKENEINVLKETFLLKQESINNAKIKLNDTAEKILEKVYQADAKIIAKTDAEIRMQLEKLNELDTRAEDYKEVLEQKVNELVKLIPEQNRLALTSYVARRKIVLDLYNKILNNELQIQRSTDRQIDEKLFHNLIFQQSSDKPDESDLWLINEDFIYFKGTSEGRLGDISVDDVKIVKEKLTQEEETYRKSLNEDRYLKRPDILLFPSEGKCIIIEFKSPDVNVSDHILQINNYASLIHNLSKVQFSFTTFYGYLIGEMLDADDIQNKDSSFIPAYHFNYVFRPHYRIIGKFGKIDGSLYTEVITYSTLLERAIKRNKVFIDKLTHHEKKIALEIIKEMQTANGVHRH